MAKDDKKTPPAAAAVAEGMALMTAPEGATSCSHDGQEFDVVDGMVEVPVEAVADLLSHGYAI